MTEDLSKFKPLRMRGEDSEGKAPRPRIKPRRREEEEEDVPWIEPAAEAIDMEGDLVTIDQLVGCMVYVYDVVERPSQFGDRPYIYAQIKVDGAPYVLRTGSAPVVGAILHQKREGKMPFRAIVDEVKSAKGRRYYVLTGPSTADEED